MNTAIFKTWLVENGNSPKVASDTISRLKKLDSSLIESPISSSVDSEFNKDTCDQLLKCFSKSGENPVMDSFQLYSLPIGKRSIHTYKLSLTKYITFKKEYPDG
jgi:hypothetical protein